MTKQREIYHRIKDDDDDTDYIIKAILAIIAIAACFAAVLCMVNPPA